MTETIQYGFIDTPLGTTRVAWSDGGVVSIRLRSKTSDPAPDSSWRLERDVDNDATRQLQAYFAGELREFDLDLDPRGTPFQLEVWRALQGIPYAETRSYGDVARSIGRPKAVRAVGAANGRNDIPIVVPCHRVIGSGGELRGYAGGVDLKAALLNFERTGVWNAQSGPGSHGPRRLGDTLSLW